MAKYEFDGDKYLKASKHQKEWGKKLISELEIKEKDFVLDLGCGDGLLTKIISDIVKKGYALGIDASKGMITKAKEYERGNLKFQVLDIIEIDFTNEFDVIISNATLHWVKDHKKMLKSCYKALKPNGIIRFNFAGDGNCSNFFKVVKNKIKSEDFVKYFTHFEWPWFMPGKKEYQLIIEKTPFSEIKIWEENADRFFSNEEEMTRWIDQPSIVPFLNYIDNKRDKENFRNQVVKEMIRLTKKEDGRCFETFRRINVYARK